MQQTEVIETKHEHEQAKKSYQSPSLTRYGSVRELTMGGAGSKQEGGMGSNPVKFP